MGDELGKHILSMFKLCHCKRMSFGSLIEVSGTAYKDKAAACNTGLNSCSSPLSRFNPYILVLRSIYSCFFRSTIDVAPFTFQSKY